MNDSEKQYDPLRARLGELRLEMEKGQRHLELLEQRSQEVRNTVLRISGAIQVLEELLHEPVQPASNIAPTGNCRRTTAELVTP